MEEVRGVRVRLTRTAQRQFDAILRSIHAESPSGAKRVRQRFERIVRHIATFPEATGTTDDRTVRKVTLSPFPYIMFYRMAGTDLIVTTVRHGARDPATMPGAPKPDPGDD